jgi:PPP family 3-phenylpropionic acid transporter
MSHQASDVPYWRLSGFYFFYFALLGTWLPFWPLYLQNRDFSADQIGYLMSVMVGTKIIAPNIWGWLADITGRRMLIIRGGSLVALLCFSSLFFSDQSFWSLVWLIAGFSFFWNAVLTQFDVATLSHLGQFHQRYSQIRVWGSIGFIVAVAGLGLFFDYFSVTWLPWFVVLLLASIWISSLLVEERVMTGSGGQVKRSLRQVIRQPAVVVFLLTCFLLQVSHGPYYTFFSVYLEDHGYSHTTTGLLWSLGVFAEVLLFMVMHKVMQRYNLHQIMICSLLLSVLRWLLIAFYVESWPLLIFAQCLHAASFGSYHAFAIEMVRRLFGGGLEGQGMALYSGLSYGAGGAVGAVLSGWLWDISPQLCFVLAAMTCLLAMVISLLVGNKLVEQPAASG